MPEGFFRILTLRSVQNRHLISLLGLSIALTFGTHAHAESPGAYYTFRNSGEKIHVPLVKAREYSSLCSGVLRLDDGIPVYVEPFESLETDTEGCSTDGEFNGDLGAYGGLGAKCATKTAVRNDPYLDGGKTWADLLDLSALAAPSVSAASERTAQKIFLLKPAYRLGSIQQTQDVVSNYLIMGLPLEGKAVEEKWRILTEAFVCPGPLDEDSKVRQALESISTNKYIVIDPNRTARSVFVFDSLAIPQLFFLRDQNAIGRGDKVSESWSNRIIEPGWLRSTEAFSTVIVPELSVWESRLNELEEDAEPKATAIFSRDDRSGFVLQFKEPVAESDDNAFLHRRLTIPLPRTKNSEQAVELIKKITVSLENDLDSIEPVATDGLTFDLLRRGSLDLFPEEGYDVAKNTAKCNELGAAKVLENKMFFRGRSPLTAFGDGEYVFRVDIHTEKMLAAVRHLCAQVQLLDDVDPDDFQGPTGNYAWIVDSEETKLKSVAFSEKDVPADLGDGQEVVVHEFLQSTVHPVGNFAIVRPGDEEPGVPPPAMKFILVRDQGTGSGAYYIQDFPITIHAALSYFRDPRFQSKKKLRTNFFGGQAYVDKCFFRMFHYATLVADQIPFGTDLPLEEELLAVLTANRLATFLLGIGNEEYAVLFSPIDSRECLEAIFLGFASVSDFKVRTEGLNWVKSVRFEEEGSSTSLGEELRPGGSKLKERIILAMGLEFEGADAEEQKKQWMALDASAIEDELREGQIDKTLSQVIDQAEEYFNKFRGSDVLPLALASGEDAVRFAHGLFRLPVGEDETLQTQFTLAANQDWKLVPLSKTRVDALVDDNWVQYDRNGGLKEVLGTDPSVSFRSMDGDRVRIFAPVENNSDLSAAERFELAIFDLLDGPAQEFQEGFHDTVLPKLSVLQKPENWQKFSSRLMIEPALEKKGE